MSGLIDPDETVPCKNPKRGKPPVFYSLEKLQELSEHGRTIIYHPSNPCEPIPQDERDHYFPNCLPSDLMG